VSGPGLPSSIARRAGTRKLFYPYSDELRSGHPISNCCSRLRRYTGGKVRRKRQGYLRSAGRSRRESPAVVAVVCGCSVGAFPSRYSHAARAICGRLFERT
jgi:hypothetical protein